MRIRVNRTGTGVALVCAGTATLLLVGVAAGGPAFPEAAVEPCIIANLPPDCTPTPSPSATGSATESPTDEPTETGTPTEDPSETPSGCPTGSETPTGDPTDTETPTDEPTGTETPTDEPTGTETPTDEPTSEPPTSEPPTSAPPTSATPTSEDPIGTVTSLLDNPPVQGAPRAGVGETPTDDPSATETPSEEPTSDPCPTTIPTKVVFFATTRIPFASMYTFSAKVTKPGGLPVTGGSVSFLLPGYTFTGPVDGNGYARVRTRIAINVGNYRLNLRYNPAAGFAESKQQVGFQVIRTTSSCELYRQLIPNQSRLTGALRYPDRSRIPNVGVVFWYNGRAIANRVTNSIGVATLDTTRGRSGDTFTFSYPGDSKRAGCSKTIRVP